MKKGMGHGPIDYFSLVFSVYGVYKNLRLVDLRKDEVKDVITE